MNPADIKAGPLPDIDTLEIVADWKRDFQKRCARARLRHELIGVDPEEIVSLGDEGREIVRIIMVLKGVIGHA